MMNLARNEIILRRPFLDFNLFICWEHNDCEMFHLGQTYHGPQWADCCFFTQLLSWASVPVIVSLSLHLYCVLNISILPSNLHSCHFFPPTFFTDAVLTPTNLSNYSEIYVTKMGICLLYNSQNISAPISFCWLFQQLSPPNAIPEHETVMKYGTCVWLLVSTCSNQCTFISNERCPFLGCISKWDRIAWRLLSGFQGFKGFSR